MANKRKHNTNTLKDKLDALKRLDSGESVTKLAKELNVGKATICDWKKKRVKLENYCATFSSQTLEKRLTSKQSQYEKLNEALFVWFSQEREKGTPLNRPIIQKKALQINKLINGNESFNASIGWLDRFQKRHGIRHLNITREHPSSDHEAAKEYVSEFQSLITEGDYSPQQIYNADEIVLNFRSLPTISLAEEEEIHAPGFKMYKDHVTLMACSNSSGKHKLPLVLIGKEAKPRAFKNVNMNSLPVYYRNQKRASMDGELFKEWFYDEFIPRVKQFSKDNDLPPRAILLIDNAPTHPNAEELVAGDIKAAFLPPNVTPLLQPMDQGVLKLLKQKYRKQYLRTLIEDNTASLVRKIKQVNTKYVVYSAAESWENISEHTIRKSWTKLWPTLEFEENHVENDKDNLLQLVQKIPGYEEAINTDVTEWMVADGESAEYLSDADIIAAVTQETMECEQDSDNDSQCDMGELVSHADAAVALDLALRYLEQQPTATPADTMFMRRWKNYASSNRLPTLCRKIKTERFSCDE